MPLHVCTPRFPSSLGHRIGPSPSHANYCSRPASTPHEHTICGRTALPYQDDKNSRGHATSQNPLHPITYHHGYATPQGCTVMATDTRLQTYMICTGFFISRLPPPPPPCPHATLSGSFHAQDPGPAGNPGDKSLSLVLVMIGRPGFESVAQLERGEAYSSLASWHPGTLAPWRPGHPLLPQATCAGNHNFIRERILDLETCWLAHCCSLSSLRTFQPPRQPALGRRHPSTVIQPCVPIPYLQQSSFFNLQTAKLMLLLFYFRPTD